MVGTNWSNTTTDDHFRFRLPFPFPFSISFPIYCEHVQFQGTSVVPASKLSFRRGQLDARLEMTDSRRVIYYYQTFDGLGQVLTSDTASKCAECILTPFWIQTGWFSLHPP